MKTEIRFGEDGYREVEAAAALEGKPPSVFIREAAMAAAKARISRAAKR